LRERVRTQGFTGEQPYIGLVIKQLNTIFGTAKESLVFWNQIGVMLATNFPNSETGLPPNLKEYITNYKIVHSEQSKQTGLCLLFDLLSDRCGLKWRGTVRHEFANSPHLFEVDRPFTNTDLSSLDEKVKRTELIGHSQGVILRMQGMSTKSRGKYSEILFIQSLVKFRQSAQAVPRNQRTLRNVADVFDFLGKKGLAKLFYLTAIEASENDAISLYKYAYFLDSVLNDDSAKDYYVKSIKNKMTTGSVLALAKFLTVRKEIEEAENLLEQACKKFPESGVVQHYMANFYHYVKIDHQRAKNHYQSALTSDSKNTNFLNDYIQLLKDIGEAESADVYQTELNNLMKRTHSVLVSSFRVQGLRQSNSVNLSKSKAADNPTASIPSPQVPKT